MNKKLLFIGFIVLSLGIPVFAEEKPEMIIEKAEKVSPQKAFTLGEVLVTDKNDTSSKITVIKGKDAEKSAKTDLINVINEKIPSFYTANNRIMGFGVAGSGAAQMSIRGIGNSGWSLQTGSGPTTGLPILINGMDTTMMINNHPVADIFTMKNIEKIEILHGPQPVLYGSSAMGGIVNVLTERRKEEGYSTKVSASYGTDNQTDNFISHNGKTGRFDYALSYNLRYTDGDRKQLINTTEFTSEYLSNNGTMHMGYRLSKNWYLGIDGYLMDEKINDPGAEGETKNDLEVFDITRGGTVIQIGNTFKSLEGSLQLYGNWGHHKSTCPVNNDAAEYESDDSMYGYKLRESLEPVEGTVITAGSEFRRYGGKSENKRTGYIYCDDEFIKETSFFGLVEQDIMDSFFVLNGGGRWTWNSEYGNYGSWQTGLISNPLEDTRIHFNAAQGFKLPDIIQLFNKWWSGDHTAVESDSDLKPETYTSIELGIEQALFDRLEMNLTAYRIFSKNRFVRKFVMGHTEWMNMDDFNYNGIEAGISYSPVKMVSLETGYSYIANKQNGKTLTYVPEHKLLAGVSFEGYNIFVGLTGQYVKNIYASECEKDLIMMGNDYTVEHRKLDDYFTLNAKLAYRFLERYRLFVNLNNITNRKVSTYAVYNTPDGTENGNKFHDYPMPGFSMLAGLSAEF